VRDLPNLEDGWYISMLAKDNSLFLGQEPREMMGNETAAIRE
jgi:hypothetical protein